MVIRPRTLLKYALCLAGLRIRVSRGVQYDLLVIVSVGILCR